MSTLDKLAAFWNQRYAAEGFAYGTAPNDFLASVAGQFAAGGQLLCLADGEGRNLGGFDPGIAVWDGIVSIFVHLPPRVRRDLHARCVTGLKAGGLMVFEAYGPGQLGRGTGGPPEAELLPALADIELEFAGCRILHRFSGLRDVQEGRHHTGLGEVVQILAQKEGG